MDTSCARFVYGLYDERITMHLKYNIIVYSSDGLNARRSLGALLAVHNDTELIMLILPTTNCQDGNHGNGSG